MFNSVYHSFFAVYVVLLLHSNCEGIERYNKFITQIIFHLASNEIRSCCFILLSLCMFCLLQYVLNCFCFIVICFNMLQCNMYCSVLICFIIISAYMFWFVLMFYSYVMFWSVLMFYSYVICSGLFNVLQHCPSWPLLIDKCV